jgi:hypothetical protein
MRLFLYCLLVLLVLRFLSPQFLAVNDSVTLYKVKCYVDIIQDYQEKGSYQDRETAEAHLSSTEDDCFIEEEKQ